MVRGRTYGHTAARTGTETFAHHTLALRHSYVDRALAEGVGIAVAAARWARELRVRGRQRVRGSRASRAGVLVIPVIVFGGHEDLFRFVSWFVALAALSFDCFFCWREDRLSVGFLLWCAWRAFRVVSLYRNTPIIVALPYEGTARVVHSYFGVRGVGLGPCLS